MLRDEHDAFRPDELVIQLDGDEVHPHSLATSAALDFVSAVLDLLENLGRRTKRPIQFQGLRVLDKCAAFAFSSDDIEVGRGLLEEAIHFIAGENDAPSGLGESIQRAQRTLRALPAHYACTAGVGAVRTALHAPTSSRRRFLTSIETLRAIPIRVGSAHGTTVRLQDALSREEFVLNGSASQLEKFVYGREVEVEAEVERDEDGCFVRGKLLEVTALAQSESSDVEQLRTWFQANASEWNDVEDIEAELVRD